MNIEQELERARAAARRKDGYPARAILRRVIEQQPGNIDAWLLFAEVAQKPEHAVQCLERILMIDPENEPARQKLSEVYTPRRRRRPVPTEPLQNHPQAHDRAPSNPGSSFPERGESLAGARDPFDLSFRWQASPGKGASAFNAPEEIAAESCTSGNGASGKGDDETIGNENDSSHPAALAPFRAAYEFPGPVDDPDPPGRAALELLFSGNGAEGQNWAGEALSEAGATEGAVPTTGPDGPVFSSSFSEFAGVPASRAARPSRIGRTAGSRSSSLELAILIVAGILFLCVVTGLVFLILGGARLLPIS